MDSSRTESRQSDPVLAEPWHVRLYVAGYTPSSMAAIRNVKVLEAEYFPSGSIVEIVNLLEDPDAARRDHILALPTLIKLKPQPLRRIIGSLSDIAKTLSILGFSSGSSAK